MRYVKVEDFNTYEYMGKRCNSGDRVFLEGDDEDGIITLEPGTLTSVKNGEFVVKLDSGGELSVEPGHLGLISDNER